MKAAINAIAIDLDGTLLSEKETIHSHDIYAVQMLHHGRKNFSRYWQTYSFCTSLCADDG